MEEESKIKSDDLCERCEHGEENCGLDCKKCEMWSKLDAACICDHIYYGTPCPYFVEKQEENK